MWEGRSRPSFSIKMFKAKIKDWHWLLAIFLLSSILFFPAFKTFFTHDDFFLLKISKIDNFQGFLNFFNLIRGPEGLGMYRPLSMQIFYLLDWKLFNLDPFGLRVVSFLTFFTVIFLVYKFAKLLVPDRKVALVAAFLYGTAASHFGHLYAFGAYSELLVTLFSLLGAISFVGFVKGKPTKYWYLSFLSFLAALLSKETFAIIPLLFVLIYLFYLVTDKKGLITAKKLIVSLVPFILVLAGYFYMRFRYFGFPEGDSYVWVFSFRVFNTFFWYLLWALNLPEMLVDFVGSGFAFNPNLFKYYSQEIIPIFALFGALVVGLTYLIARNFKKLFSSRHFLFTILFSAAWFAISLLPILFLPLHKFTYYLTLPMVGFAIFVSYVLVNNKKRRTTILFLGIWLSLSILTLTLTAKTHWMTRGAQTARNVHRYIKENISMLEQYKTISFFDIEEDKELPWSPTEVLKVTLSDLNYFKVFWSGKWQVMYSKTEGPQKFSTVQIRARRFLGY